MIKDITGKKFGRLTVIRLSKRVDYDSVWECLCECGKVAFVFRSNLRTRHTKSCGCLNAEMSSQRAKTHGMRNTKFYSIYHPMKDRCENPNKEQFAHYGGRGIKCLWKSYEDFEKDMYESYKSHVDKFGDNNTTIERIDNNGNYCKENCRWATRKEQARNRRSNVLIEFNEQTKCLIEWAEIYDIPFKTLWWRIVKAKWPVEVALTKQVT